MPHTCRHPCLGWATAANRRLRKAWVTATACVALLPLSDSGPLPSTTTKPDPSHPHSQTMPLSRPLPMRTVDIDECAANATLCSGPSVVAGSCVNTPGSYQCSCNTGYRGFDPTTNTCSGKAGGGELFLTCIPLLHAKSVVATVHIWCALLPTPGLCPFTSTYHIPDSNNPHSQALPLPLPLPVSAVDINECVANATICSHPSLVATSCVNTPGSYSCSCNAGYQGFDRTTNTCAGKAQGRELHLAYIPLLRAKSSVAPVRIDCALLPAPDPVPFASTHHKPDPNNPQSQTMHLPCPLPMHTVDIDECAANATICNGPSLVAGSCVNTPGSYQCSCNTGYRGFDRTTNTCAGKAQGRGAQLLLAVIRHHTFLHVNARPVARARPRPLSLNHIWCTLCADPGAPVAPGSYTGPCMLFSGS